MENDKENNSKTVDFATPIKEKFGELPDNLVQDLIDDATRGGMSVDGLLTYAEKPVAKFQEDQVREENLSKKKKELKELIGDDYEDKINKYRSNLKDDGFTDDEINNLTPKTLNSLINSFESKEQNKSNTQKYNWKVTNKDNSMMSNNRSSDTISTKSFDDMKNESIEHIRKEGIDRNGRLNEGADRKMAYIIGEIMKRKYKY